MELEFWYDFSAPYAYPSAWRVERLAGLRGLKVVWRPFLAPAADPFPPERYLWRDLERICQRDMLPFRRPAIFPRRTLLASRLALFGAGRGWGAQFSRGVFAAYYGRDRDISDTKTLEPLLKDAGANPQEALTGAVGGQIKDALRANGREAQEKGVFGAPTFVRRASGAPGGEVFWGDDRLEHAVGWAAPR
jgi:2-hydroxychromene-2-carboxylate isomerase